MSDESSTTSNLDRYFAEDYSHADFDQLDRGQRLERVVGGVMRKGRPWCLIKWLDEEELDLAPLDYVKRTFPHSLSAVTEFKYFS